MAISFISKSLKSFHHGQCSKAQLRTAGNCINKKFGEAAKIIWGIGLLSAGQSATMTVCQKDSIFYIETVYCKYFHLVLPYENFNTLVLQGTYAGQFVMEVIYY